LAVSSGVEGLTTLATGGAERVKGNWLLKLPRRVLDGSLTVSEALAYVRWRISQQQSLQIEGIRFEGVDPLVWGLITEIFINREYSPKGFEIGRSDSVVDIGSHHGVFAAFAANRTSGPIVAVEPDAISYGFLARLVETNGLNNVTPVQAAVSDTSGSARLFRSSGSSRHTLVGVDQRTGEDLQDSVMVRTTSLNDLLASHPIVHLLKMDCEGAEYSIMDAISDSLLARIERLVMEVHGLGEEERFRSLAQRLESSFDEVFHRRISDTMGIVYARRMPLAV